MPSEKQNLPDDVETLKAIVWAQREEIKTLKGIVQAQREEIEALKLQIAQLKRMVFGRRAGVATENGR